MNLNTPRKCNLSSFYTLRLDSLVLALIAGGPTFNRDKGRCHTKDVKKMAPVVPLFST